MAVPGAIGEIVIRELCCAGLVTVGAVATSPRLLSEGAQTGAMHLMQQYSCRGFLKWL